MQSQSILAIEADIIVPGSFVALQGVPGDGSANNIDSCPILKTTEVDEEGDDEDYQHLEISSESRSTASSIEPLNRVLGGNPALLPPPLSTLSVQPLKSTTSGQLIHKTAQSRAEDSFVVVDDEEDNSDSAKQKQDDSVSRKMSDNDHRAVKLWNSERRLKEIQQRQDWLSVQETTVNENTGRTAAWMEQDLWWLDSDGRITVLKSPPERSKSGHVVLQATNSSLDPGSTVVGTELLCLDSYTFRPVSTKATPSIKTNSDDGSRVYPRGRPGWVQLLKIETPVVGWVVLSIDGSPLLAPGLPSIYVEPSVWLWRVTCSVGAFVREGLELTTRQVETLPYGAFLQVTGKMVNSIGLSRLRIRAVVENEDSSSRLVEGWISEALNPLSGQHGPVAQPLPFPVPALYKVTLREGAVIRSGVELSSPQVGKAPMGSVLSIVGRAFSEHPQDRCIERLCLAGNGGWISIRLCEDPPMDELIVKLVGIDGTFEPSSPGAFHLDAQLRVQQEQANSSPEDQAGILGVEEMRLGDLSEIGSSDSSTHTSPGRKPKSITRRPPPTPRRGDVCLICLAEERNATIIHGETGHICCCLQCARILKQKGDRCPVCRLPIHSVIQHFYV